MTLEKLKKTIAEIDGEVVLRSDLAQFGSERAVSRMIKELVVEGVITRIGLGIYAKTVPGKFVNRPVLRTTFAEVGWQACQRLGIEVQLGRAMREYNEGKSTQVPVRIIFNTGQRIVKRKIARGLQQIYFENEISRGLYPSPLEKNS